MSIYTCGKCLDFKDDDYLPPESVSGEMLCPSCTDEQRCPECGEVAEWVEDSFDYGGTHCTNGKGGTHFTGTYSTKCCGAQE